MNFERKMLKQTVPFTRLLNSPTFSSASVVHCLLSVVSFPCFLFFDYIVGKARPCCRGPEF